MKVAVIHLARTWSSTYSLSSVVREQLVSLSGTTCLDVSVLVRQDVAPPEWLPKNLDYRPVFAKDAVDLPTLAAELAEFDLVVTHDLIMLPANRLHCDALAEVSRRLPDVKWTHFLHASVHAIVTASTEVRELGFRNAKVICLAPSLVADVAQLYGLSPDRVGTLTNRLSAARLLGLNERVQRAFDVKSIIDADVAMLHPFALSRAVAKQPFHLLFLAAALQKLGKTSKILFVDRREENCGGLQTKLSLKWLAARLGLPTTCLSFLSDGDEAPQGLTQEEVSSLYRLTNVFVHPSFSEAGPLAVLEASANGNLCVVNDDVSAFHDMLGEHAIYHAFSHPEIGGYQRTYAEMIDYFAEHAEAYGDLATKVSAELSQNKLVGAKRRFLAEYSAESLPNAFERFCLEAGGHGAS